MHFDDAGQTSFQSLRVLYVALRPFPRPLKSKGFLVSMNLIDSHPLPRSTSSSLNVHWSFRKHSWWEGVSRFRGAQAQRGPSTSSFYSSSLPFFFLYHRARIRSTSLLCIKNKASILGGYFPAEMLLRQSIAYRVIGSLATRDRLADGQGGWICRLWI